MAQNGNYIDLILSKKEIEMYEDIILLFNEIYFLLFLNNYQMIFILNFKFRCTN